MENKQKLAKLTKVEFLIGGSKEVLIGGSKVAKNLRSEACIYILRIFTNYSLSLKVENVLDLFSPASIPSVF